MAYWLASQNENYSRAIDAGTLWTLPATSGRWSWGRLPIFELLPGDIVLHHEDMRIRAVSRVVAAAIRHGRPPENPLSPGEVNVHDSQGQLVRVEVLRKDLNIPQAEYAALIPHGANHGGPLDKNGHVKQAFIQRLDSMLARKLLASQNAVVVDREPTPYGSLEGISATDSSAVTTIRNEQDRLRAYLLQGAREGTCDLCGRELPADLLVAAHIQRRCELTDAERLEFDKVAMLACVLGCDALFEAGYLAVDASGQIVPGRKASTSTVATEVAKLTGKHCPRHTDRTAARFAARHAQAVQS